MYRELKVSICYLHNENSTMQLASLKNGKEIKTFYLTQKIYPKTNFDQILLLIRITFFKYILHIKQINKHI